MHKVWINYFLNTLEKITCSHCLLWNSKIQKKIQMYFSYCTFLYSSYLINFVILNFLQRIWHYCGLSFSEFLNSNLAIYEAEMKYIFFQYQKKKSIFSKICTVSIWVVYELVTDIFKTVTSFSSTKKKLWIHFFRYFGIDLLFLKIKWRSIEFRKIPHLKYMRKLGATEDFRLSSGLLQKIWKNFW